MGCINLRKRTKNLLEKFKKLIKKIIILKYTDDGRSIIYIRFPFRFDSKLMFALRHGIKPIQPRKIVFDNYMGKGYGCNPKYVAEKLLEKYPGKFEVVWIVSKGDAVRGEIPDWIRQVDYASQKALREYATAKVWVSNYHKISFLRRGLFKRKGQYFIQMWHGSLGIKKIENNVSCLTVDKRWLKLAKRSSKMVDFWISDSSFENDVYRRAFWDVKDILMYGHPRNDILLCDHEAAADKVKTRFEIENKKILLYAPTFREDYRLDCYQIDFGTLQQILKAKFGGEWAILVRLHPRVRKYIKKILPPYPGIYDATYYTDIQELIASADCMITDYSSCIFDFMLTRQPGFIFATDIEEFNTERGFYYPLEDTPFPIARSNEELFQEIECFDETAYRNNVEEFLMGKGCVEDGHASERVADKIAELTGVAEHEQIKVNQEKTAKAVLNTLYEQYHDQPVQMNKIVCVNFHGKGYGGDPKYIVEELLKRRKDLDIVWLSSGEPEEFVFPTGVRTVPYHSEQAIWEIATARVLIDNTMKFTGFKKRPDQFFIQTWHGSIPLKKIGFDNPTNLNSKKYEERVSINFPYTDLILSNSRFASELFRSAFRYDGAILEKGCPRNDILLNTPPSLKIELCERYQIPSDKKIILCVLTNKSTDADVIDFQKILEHLGDEYSMLTYLHPGIRSKSVFLDQVNNVSDCPDVQELMAISDMMITDDSESVLEYVLTGRPAYLFAADIGIYRRKWDCYFEISELPVSVFASTEELLLQLDSADIDIFHAKVKQFKEKVGFKETRQATQYTVDFIEKIVQGEINGINFDIGSEMSQVFEADNLN